LRAHVSPTRNQYPSIECMIALDYVAAVLAAISIVVTALASYGNSSEGDENVPVNDRWNLDAFILILIIGLVC
jgi:hypothetical protein